ncbi:unnamed protein product, partial [Litomosoides sigmodontis]
MGRDHGVPPYTVWREYCGGSKVQSFDDLIDELIGEGEVVDELAKIYKTVDDMDLFLIGLAEKSLHGALLGPTFSCIISLQFQKTKEGDRYWYENDLAQLAFTNDQLAEIRKTTMAKVLCGNVEYFDELQPRVFELANNYDNYPINCNETLRTDLDVKKWLDEFGNHNLRMPLTEATIANAFEIAMKKVRLRREREQRNIRKNQYLFKSGDPLLSYGKMMRAKDEAIAIARRSDIFLEVTKNLMAHIELESDKRLGKLSISEMQNLLQQIDISPLISKIDPFIGPHDELVEKCLPKKLPCDDSTPYRTASGIDMPRAKSLTGELLPSARVISNAIHFDLPISQRMYSHMIMQFGQILDHEVTHSPVER